VGVCICACFKLQGFFFSVVENGVVVNKPNKNVHIVLKQNLVFNHKVHMDLFDLLLYMDQTWRLVLELMSP